MPAAVTAKRFRPLRGTLADARRYLKTHRDLYHQLALNITPDREQWPEIWERLAFAILSANAVFAQAVKALAYARAHKGSIDAEAFTRYSMPRAKAAYLNALPCDDRIKSYLRQPSETWDAYRTRLASNIKGLGLTKASFAAALLYPTEAECCCLDTWMLKLFDVQDDAGALRPTSYRAVEVKVTRIAHTYHLSTFECQWALWDMARGTVETHEIFIPHAA